MTRLWKLLTLIAVLFMPIGMAPAAAAGAHRSPAAMMRHCPGKPPSDDKAGFAECTMACAAALPAVEAPEAKPLVRPAELPRITASQTLCGLHPETATPPPKLS